MKDYYYILGVDTTATESQIKSAYRKLSIKFHPDKNDGDKFFEDRFKDIQEAYEILSNFSKRSEYDIRLKSLSFGSNNTINNKKYEEELKKQYEEELRKKEEEIKRKYQTPEQRASEEAEIKRKEGEEKKKAEQQRLLNEFEKHKKVLLQKEKELNTLQKNVLKIESEITQLKKYINDLNLKIICENNKDDNPDTGGEITNYECIHCNYTQEYDFEFCPKCHKDDNGVTENEKLNSLKIKPNINLEVIFDRLNTKLSSHIRVKINSNPIIKNAKWIEVKKDEFVGVKILFKNNNIYLDSYIPNYLAKYIFGGIISGLFNHSSRRDFKQKIENFVITEFYEK